ncbi:MAG: coproporphyrinogen III oxidase, partial [Vicinamibacterales bacterium]
IRELVLQLKLGTIDPRYFLGKYGVDILTRFRDAFASLAADGYAATVGPDRVSLTRDGLLRVDVLLPRFFLPAHAGIRYT